MNIKKKRAWLRLGRIIGIILAIGPSGLTIFGAIRAYQNIAEPLSLNENVNFLLGMSRVGQIISLFGLVMAIFCGRSLHRLNKSTAPSTQDEKKPSESKTAQD